MCAQIWSFAWLLDFFVIRKTSEDFRLLSSKIFKIFMIKHCLRFQWAKKGGKVLKLGEQISFQRLYILKTTMMYEAKVSQHSLYVFHLWCITFWCKSVRQSRKKWNGTTHLYIKKKNLTLIMCLNPNLPPPQFHSSFFSVSANVIIYPKCPE